MTSKVRYSDDIKQRKPLLHFFALCETLRLAFALPSLLSREVSTARFSLERYNTIAKVLRSFELFPKNDSYQVPMLLPTSRSDGSRSSNREITELAAGSSSDRLGVVPNYW